MENYTYEQMIENFENTIKILENKYSVNKSCRFYKTLKDYKNINKLNEKDIHSQRLIEGISDLYQLSCILDCKELINTDFGKKEIDKIWGGSDLQEDDKNYLHRNIQYQLFIMSLFNKSFKTFIEEPDFSIIFFKKKHYVAVKRIHSEDKIYSEIKDAQKQIEKYGNAGIIVIGLDLILLQSCKNEDYFDLLGQYIEKLIYTQTFEEIINRKTIKNIIFTCNLPEFDAEKKKYTLNLNTIAYAVVKPSRYGKRFMEKFKLQKGHYKYLG